jgi:predicted lipid-binding transport protein (Tim44 family)
MITAFLKKEFALVDLSSHVSRENIRKMKIMYGKKPSKAVPPPEPEEEPVTEEEPVAEEVAAEAAPAAEAEAEAPVEEEGVVKINQDEIKKRAYTLSQANKKYDDYVWLWAEADLKLAKAVKKDAFAPNVKSVEIDATKIVKPKEADIKKLAAEYAKKKAKVQEIHWFIAERQFVLDKATGR